MAPNGTCDGAKWNVYNLKKSLVPCYLITANCDFVQRLLSQQVHIVYDSIFYTLHPILTSLLCSHPSWTLCLFVLFTCCVHWLSYHLPSKPASTQNHIFDRYSIIFMTSSNSKMLPFLTHYSFLPYNFKQSQEQAILSLCGSSSPLH